MWYSSSIPLRLQHYLALPLWRPLSIYKLCAETRNIAMCRKNRQKGALLGWNRVNRGPVLRHDKDPSPGEGRKTRAYVYILQASWTIHNYTIYIIYKMQQPGNRGGGGVGRVRTPLPLSFCISHSPLPTITLNSSLSSSAWSDYPYKTPNYTLPYLL